jgi:hypothetical protein
MAMLSGEGRPHGRRLTRIVTGLAAACALVFASAVPANAATITGLAVTGLRVAFQGSDSFLYIMDPSGGVQNTGLRMAAGSSPSAMTTCVAGICPAMVAFQAADGTLWTYNARNGLAQGTGLVMAPNTSPALTYANSGAVEVAYAQPDQRLAVYVAGSGVRNTGNVMAPGTSPSISGPPSDPSRSSTAPVITYESDTHLVRTVTPDNATHTISGPPAGSPNALSITNVIWTAFPWEGPRVVYSAVNDVCGCRKLWVTDLAGVAHAPGYNEYTTGFGVGASVAATGGLAPDGGGDVMIAFSDSANRLQLLDLGIDFLQGWSETVARNTSPSAMMKFYPDDTGGAAIAFVGGNDRGLVVRTPEGYFLRPGFTVAPSTSPALFDQ